MTMHLFADREPLSRRRDVLMPKSFKKRRERIPMQTRYRASSRLAQPLFSPDENGSLVQRLRRGIAEAGLDCGCREAADDMLDRVGAEEHMARRAAGLADARRMRDAIVIVLALLGELDELMPDEPDRSAFHELAGLFQDIADFALSGATAARQAAGLGNGL